jgi:competence protein ComEA
VDLDRASAAEIERLPGIGPVLARRVVANRDSLGPFGSLKALERVKGIGPATAKRLAPYVTFSLSPRPSGVEKLTRPARIRWIRRRAPGPGSG